MFLLPGKSGEKRQDYRTLLRVGGVPKRVPFASDSRLWRSMSKKKKSGNKKKPDETQISEKRNYVHRDASSHPLPSRHSRCCGRGRLFRIRCLRGRRLHPAHQAARHCRNELHAVSRVCASRLVQPVSKGKGIFSSFPPFHSSHLQTVCITGSVPPALPSALSDQYVETYFTGGSNCVGGVPINTRTAWMIDVCHASSQSNVSQRYY